MNSNAAAQKRLHFALKKLDADGIRQAIKAGADPLEPSLSAMEFEADALSFLIWYTTDKPRPALLKNLSDEAIYTRFDACFEALRLLNPEEIIHSSFLNISLLSFSLIQFADSRIISKLLPYSDLYQALSQHRTAAAIAIACDQVKPLQLIFDHIDFEHLSQNQRNQLFGDEQPLFLALDKKNIEILSLIASFYDPNETSKPSTCFNASDHNPLTALHFLIRTTFGTGDFFEAALALLLPKSDLLIKDKRGFTAIDEARNLGLSDLAHQLEMIELSRKEAALLGHITKQPSLELATFKAPRL